MTMRTFLTFTTLALAAAAVAMPAHAADGRRPALVDFSTCAYPKWPDRAWQLQQHGVVTLAFLVAEDGSVQDANVVTSSGYPLLDEAARAGLRKCRFKSGMPLPGEQPHWTQMQYVWSLSTGGSKEAVLSTVRAADLSAAEQGNVAAQLRVAHRLLTEVEFERDVEQGAKWLRRSADGGHPPAMEYLASLLRIGDELPRDVPAALEWYRKAAQAGRPGAQYWTGVMLLDGEAGPRDAAAGEAWLRKAAEQHHSPAEARLALVLLRRDAASTEAIALLNDAVAQGNPYAQATLARAYEQGKAVPRDYGRAAALYRDAAAHGNAEAQKALALLVEKGLVQNPAPVPAAGQ